MAIKILIADKLAPEGADFLSGQDQVQVTTAPGLSVEELIETLKHHDGVVIRSAVKMNAAVLEGCFSNGSSRLKGIARAGVGVDNIDLPTATKFGVAVMNSASASTITTAEHAFALMIALARNIGPAYRVMCAGGWDRSKYTGMQLHGKTLGVVGFGRIGQTLARRALAFGMNVIAYDPMINADTALDDRVPLLKSFDELIQQVDIVSFHVPKTDVTSNMLDRDQFQIAHPGLFVINAARGGIVNEHALIDAIESGQCGGAAFDVYENEPPPEDSPLRNHPKILTTPHLGASTVEAQEAVAVDACKALLTYLRGEGMMGVLNAAGLQLDLTERQQRFVDLAGRMVALLHAAAPQPGLDNVRFTVRGEALVSRADTIARYAMVELLRQHLDQPVNIINAPLIAEQRNIDAQTIIGAEHGEERLGIEIVHGGQTHQVSGAIYADGAPRITSLDGYSMDMVPAGHMVLLTNADEPGRIGLVGRLFGDANINIAEMVIARRESESTSGQTAMMILKLDEAPSEILIESLRNAMGILSVAVVVLERLEKVEG